MNNCNSFSSYYKIYEAYIKHYLSAYPINEERCLSLLDFARYYFLGSAKSAIIDLLVSFTDIFDAIEEPDKVPDLGLKAATCLETGLIKIQKRYYPNTNFYEDFETLSLTPVLNYDRSLDRNIMRYYNTHYENKLKEPNPLKSNDSPYSEETTAVSPRKPITLEELLPIAMNVSLDKDIMKYPEIHKNIDKHIISCIMGIKDGLKDYKTYKEKLDKARAVAKLKAYQKNAFNSIDKVEKVPEHKLDKPLDKLY